MKHMLPAIVKTIHKRKSPEFQCQESGKKLAGESGLTINTGHISFKLFICEPCGNLFTLPNSLMYHWLNHHLSFPLCRQNCATKKNYSIYIMSVHSKGQQEVNNVWNLRQEGKPEESCNVCSLWRNILLPLSAYAVRPAFSRLLAFAWNKRALQAQKVLLGL